MNIDVLRAREAAIEAELRDINTSAGDRSLNDDEQARWIGLESEMEQVRSDITAAEAAAQRAAEVEARRARWGSVQIAPVRTDAFDLSNMRGASPDMLRDRAMAAFDDRAMVRMAGEDAIGEVLRKIETVRGAAEHALVHGSPAYRSAFENLLTSAARGIAPVLSNEEAVALRASLSLTSANGGYTLPTLLDPTLIKTGTATKNPIRRVARVETGTQNVWNGVTAGAVTTAWKGEGSAFTDGSPTTGGVSVTAAALTAYVTGSYEIFADSNLFGQLPGLVGEAIDFAEGSAFISGSGSGAPKGIITAISATAGCKVTATTRGSFTSASAVDTIALLNAVPVRYEDSATWLMNKATYNTIRQQVVGTAGVPLIDMASRDMLLDSPIVRASDMASATTSGTALIVLGDFSEFIVYDRLGVNVEIIQNVVDGDGIPLGKRGLVAYKRVGSDVATVGAFKFLLT